MAVKNKKNILKDNPILDIVKPKKEITEPKSTNIFQPKPSPFISTKPKTLETPKPSDGSGIEVFRDDKGNITGFVRNGQPYLGLSDKEARSMIAGYTEKAKTPEGAREIPQARQQEEAALATQQLGNITPEQLAAARQQVGGEAPIDWGQALTAGAASAVPSAIGFAGAGAAAGLATGGAASIPLAVVGGVAGLVKGFYSGIRSNIKQQQSGEIQAAQKVLTNARSNLRQLRMLAQSDPSKADESVELYNQQMALVYAAHSKLKLETQGNLNKFMDDGTEKLAEFEYFLMPGGYAELQRMRIYEALMKGVPLSPEEILMQLQEDNMEEQND